MKKVEKIKALCVVVLFLGLAIAPAVDGQLVKTEKQSKTFKESEISPEMAELQVYNCKDGKYEKTTKEIPMDEALELKERIQEIQKLDIPLREKIDLQLAVLKEKEIIPADANLDDIMKNFNERWSKVDKDRLMKIFGNRRDSNGAIFNVFCGLLLQTDMGAGLVFGTHTLLPTIGVDIFGFFTGGLGWVVITSGLLGEQSMGSAYYDNFLGFFLGFAGFLIFGILGMYGPFILAIGVAGITAWVGF